MLKQHYSENQGIPGSYSPPADHHGSTKALGVFLNAPAPVGAVRTCYPGIIHKSETFNNTRSAIFCSIGHFIRVNRQRGILMWTAAFYGFFWSGEITVSTEKSFDPTKHLARRDKATDNTEDIQSLKVHFIKIQSGPNT